MPRVVFLGRGVEVMTITLPPELDRQIAERARAEGISSEEYVERLVRDATLQVSRSAAVLPSWPGRALSDLHREQLYDDAL
jgi:hypothetical protein